MQAIDGKTPDGARTAWERVGEFHAAFALPQRNDPAPHIPLAEAQLRERLLDEEVNELRAAVGSGDIIGIADALADIVYIACGTAHVYGIDLDAVFDEVHRSNMTKLGPDGFPLYREDGKVLKGPHYRPPDVAAVLGIDPDDNSQSKLISM